MDLNSLLTSLRSDYFPAFAQQIFFIDACANYVMDWHVYATLPIQTFPTGNPLVTREQFVCLAARPGEYAKNVTSQQMGFFSQIVREELAQQGSDNWPPDMDRLATSLAERFNKLRADGLVKQTPTHFWYRNWRGDEHLLSDVPVVSNKTAPTTETLIPAQRRELTSLLWACEMMRRKQDRETLLKDLRYAIRVNTRRNHENDLFDIRGIVDSCLNYSGGLHELIEIVRYYEQDSFALQQVDAFMARIPPRW